MMDPGLNRIFYSTLTCFFFLAVLAQLTLCIYMTGKGRRWYAMLPDFVIFVISMVLMSEISDVMSEDIMTGRPPRISWSIVLAGTVTLLGYSFVRMFCERSVKRRVLSPGAVRYALDRIAPGICFADHSGRIIMINRNMVELMMTLMGGYPQMCSEVRAALDDPGNGVVRLEEAEDLYRFPDGNIWKFRTFALNDPELQGYTQILAEDLTDVYRVNERLRESTEELRATNESLSEMYDKLAERIRVTENVNLKMSIHNNMGSSLLALSGIISGTSEGDEEQEIKILKNAVSYFSNDRPDQPKTMDDVINRAGKINVRVITEGEFPEDAEMQSLVAVAAGECVTNCVRHAGGSEVLVSSVADGDSYTVRMTNNGKDPDGPVAEGGGLSSLRRRAEAAGVVMKIEVEPEFALILLIRRKEPKS